MELCAGKFGLVSKKTSITPLCRLPIMSFVFPDCVIPLGQASHLAQSTVEIDASSGPNRLFKDHFSKWSF